MQQTHTDAVADCDLSQSHNLSPHASLIHVYTHDDYDDDGGRFSDDISAISSRDKRVKVAPQVTWLGRTRADLG